MEIWQIVLMILGIAVVLVIILIIIIKLNKGEAIKEEADFFLNLDANVGNGRAFGRILNVEYGDEGQEIITFMPQDLSLKEIMDDVKIEPVTVIGNKGKVITLTKGPHSRGRYIKINVPPTPDDFSSELRNTWFGKALQLGVALDNSDNSTIKSYRQAILATEAAVENMSGGEISKANMLHFTGWTKDLIDNVIKETKKDKSPSAPSFGQHTP